MDDPVNTPAKGKIPTWIKVLLGVSLAANLLIIGAVVGVAFRVQGAVEAGGGPRSGIAFVAALEKQDRRAVMQETRPKGRKSRREGNQKMRDILANLRSETFDADAFRAALDSQKDRTRGMQDLIGASVTQRVLNMSDVQRAAYADRIEAHLKRGGKRRDKQGNKRQKQ